nr:hypothetical protein Iba_scaffold35318CG0010 [Ipomoea batatas]
MSVPTSNDMNVMLTKKMNENLGIYVDFEDNLSRSFHVYCAKSKPLSLFFILAMIAAAALLVFATPTTAGKFFGDLAKGVVATKPRCCGAIIGRAKLLGYTPPCCG